MTVGPIGPGDFDGAIAEGPPGTFWMWSESKGSWRRIDSVADRAVPEDRFLDGVPGDQDDDFGAESFGHGEHAGRDGEV